MSDWDDGLPDWLPDDDDESEDDEWLPFADDSEAAGDVELSWLSGAEPLPGDVEAAEGADEGELDWLAGSFPEAEPPPVEEEDLDWLTGSNFDAAPAGDRPGASIDEEAPDDMDLPWLAEDAGFEPLPVSEPADIDEDTGLPWLSASADEEEAGEILEPDAPAGASEGEDLDLPWAGETGDSGAAEEVEIPDWLTGGDLSAGAGAPPEESEFEDTGDFFAAGADEEGFPAWLGEEEDAAGADEDSLAPDDDTPSWLERPAETPGEEVGAGDEFNFRAGADADGYEFDLAVEEPDGEAAYDEEFDFREAPTFEDGGEEFGFKFGAAFEGYSEEAAPASQEPVDLDFEALDAELGVDTSWGASPRRGAAPEDDLVVPDWFEAVDQHADAGATGEAPPAAAEPQFAPGWFMGLEEQDEAQVPEWLRGTDLSDTGDLVGGTGDLERLLLEDEEPVPAAPPPGAPLPPTSDLPTPDWFGGVEADQAAIPDWFKAADAAGTGELDFEAMFVAEEPPADLPSPDWDFGAAAGPPAEELPEPDWMSDFGASAPPPAEAAGLPEPDWMSDFGAPAPPPAEAAGLPEPDWMDSFGEAPAAPDMTGDAMPDLDWMGGPDEMPAAPDITGGAMPDLDWMGGPDAASAAPAEDDLAAPSWMDIAGAGILGDESTPTAAPARPAADDGMPDWMRMDGIEAFDEVALPGVAEEAEEEVDKLEVETGLAPDELPAWLIEAWHAQSQRLREWGITEPVGALPPAPRWIESVDPFKLKLEFDPRELARLDRAGPLQGFRATLVAEPAISTTVGEPVLVTNLMMTDQDRRQAQALGEMTAAFIQELEDAAEITPEAVEEGEAGAEAEAQPAKKRKARAVRRPRPVGRVLFSLLMLAAVIAPFFLPADLLPAAPARIPAAVSDVSALVERLNPGELVLVAFEYGGAAAPELDPAAQAVLGHVTARGARIVTLSTNPAGSLIGHRVVADLTQDSNTSPVDLGYLAGFLGGLRDLVARDADRSAPPPARFAVDYQGKPTSLNVKSVRERFKLIVVLSNEYDALRAWLEQVNTVTARGGGPLGAPVPMVAVVGAGVEPAAAAYFESGQLKGYVTGYAGTVAYAQARGAPASTVFPKAGQHANSIAAALVLAAAVILLGGVGNAIRALARRGRRSAG
ncbi:MAG: hypothetical protein JXB47_21490 [Anaerolineae bacterium]|nr:hypothetical protein [Anaerolineae bacterium]